MSDQINEQYECKKCHELYELGDGLDPSDYCNTCAQELVETFQVELDAWKTSLGTSQLSHAVAERDQLKARVSQLEIERDEALVAKDFADLACEKLEARLQEARQLLAEYGMSYRFTEEEWANWGSRRVAFVVSAHTPTGTPRPKIVCICGSSRFCDKAAVWAWEFEKRGELALSMHLLPQWYWESTGKVGEGHGAEQEGVAHILDELHLRKIDMADRVFVLNEGGYIGDRTSIEIEYAKKLGKPISYSHTPTGKA